MIKSRESFGEWSPGLSFCVNLSLWGRRVGVLYGTIIRLSDKEEKNRMKSLYE